MLDLPLVSIAAINYNNSRYVIDTLDSISKQTYPNIELVIVDDCSTDNCVELITDWLNTYDRPYKFVRHETNMGICAAYNSGLKNATGKYFTVIDTDDVMLPGKTTDQVNILEASDAKVGAVYSDAHVMDVNGVPIEGLFIRKHRQFVEIPSGNIYADLLQGNYIPCMTVMMKRMVFESVGAYDETLVYEDYDMWLRIAKEYEIVFSEFVSARYRIRPGSLTFTIKNWIYSDAKIFLKHIGGPLPTERLRNMVIAAYRSGDNETLMLMEELADKTNDRYIKIACLLWRYKISFDIAEATLAQNDKTIYSISPSGMKFGAIGTVATIVDRLFAAVPHERIKEIALSAYSENINESRPLIKEFFSRTKSRYFKTVLLLWKYKIFIPNGLIILKRIDGYCSVDVSPRFIDLCIYKDILGAIRAGNSNFFGSRNGK